jgi:hypothetical protein
MAKSKSTLPGGVRVSDLVSLGVLAEYVPRQDVLAAIKEGGGKGERDRLLPAELTTFYVIALALFRAVSYEEVLSLLLEGLRWLKLPWLGIATKAAITKARVRLGKDVLRILFERLARPISTPKTQGARFRSWLTVAFDGTTFALCDTASNAERFGRPGEHASFPMLRCLCLVETGVHAVFACAIGSFASSEAELTHKLLGALKPGMLVLADRNFMAFPIWKECLSTGADLLWRVTSSWPLKPLQTLEDGSWVAKIRSPKGSQSKEEILVRVVSYTVELSSETYRLVTSILDPKLASAEELAGLYHERWEIEGVFDEIKTHLRGAKSLLRSKTADLVEQEFWGFMIAHRALRSLMHEAALKHQLDPDELSFTHAVNVVKRTLPTRASFPP